MINLNRGISTLIALAIIIVLSIILTGGILGYQYYWIPKEEKEEFEEEKQEEKIITPDNFPYLQCSIDKDCPSADKPGWACYSYCDEENICAFKCKQYSSSISDKSFLFSSLEDINNYKDVYYWIATEDYWLDYDRDFPPDQSDYDDDLEINVTKYKGSNAESAFCELSKPACQEKLNELKNYFKELEILIEGAEPIACSPERETGFASETLKDHLVVKVFNGYRNPRDSFDYSLEVDFVIGSKEKNSYFIDLRIGDHHCYKGQVNESLLNNFSEKLSDFVHSFKFY